eukprot:CAMPEP_0194066426 /NCGR_PEP_ID=MMETSP0009_2-20130614/86017_1 /TAXON_ID=210454 /ORGANISM="Grammatophora oceanica, Strain CCMP 410" /LENGTH=224 /DNA_ID=CAMNT_0038719377 /DNA_START=99 /DNA_END=773 /DNA_ORIENTATION=-
MAPPVKAPIPAPVTGPCFLGCVAEEGSKGWCEKTTGCEGCPVADTCTKLCRRCEGRDQEFGGLDCGSCPGEPPVTQAPISIAPPVKAPVPAPVTGPCFLGCIAEEGSKGWCEKTTGCEGCPVADTCTKLCRRCEGRDQEFGGLDCGSCSGAPPPVAAPIAPPVTPIGPCIIGCVAEEFQRGWCEKTTGCEGCPIADTCAKLCRRCEGRMQLFGGLDCGDCSEFA